MNKLLLTLFVLFTTIHLHAQNGIEFTSICQDTIVYLPSTGCNIIDFSISASAETDCTDDNISFDFEIDLENDGTIDSTGTASTVITDLPIGTHQISFIAFDFCSQVDTCEIIVEVRDTIAPDLVTIFGIATVILPSSGLVNIYATDFVQNTTSDNCTAFENIRFSFSSNPDDTVATLCTGNYIPNQEGILSLNIYATDLSGNSDWTITFILVQDPNGILCPPPPPSNYVACYTPNGDFIEDITYTVTTTAGDTIIVSNNPFFNPFNNFPNFITSITPSKNLNPLNGVTTYDLVLISKHILGIELLDSPYKIIAADASQNGTISAYDIVLLRSLILHITDELPHGKSWVFDPPVDDNPTWPQSIFTGIKLGDVNDSAVPDLLPNEQIETRTPNGVLNFFTKNQTLEKGKTYTIPMLSSNFEHIVGGQFTLKFDTDALVFKNIQPNNLAALALENFGLKQVENGVVLCSWANAIQQNIPSNEAFYNITFTANQDGQLSDFLFINSSQIQAEAYAEEENEIEFWEMNLSFENEDINNGISVFPNPFSIETNFTFDLIESGNVVLDIFDASGKMVFSQNQTFPAGQNNIIIRQSDLAHSGLYFYKIQTQNRGYSGKIFLK